MLSHCEIQEIRRYEPFNKLSEESLVELSGNIRREEFKANEIICHQGDESNKLYLMVAGLVTLSRVSFEGQEKVIDILEAGQTISETCLFLDGPQHMATAKAVTDVVVYSFKRTPIKEHLANNPSCCMQFLSSLSKKFVDSVLEIESITMDSAISRVANYLVKKTDAGSEISSNDCRVFRLPVQKQLLASRLAITPETLSRIFNKFRNEKLIQINGQEIQIPNIYAIKEKYLEAC